MEKQYARIQDGIAVEYPLAEQTIRARYPLTSFPTPFRAPEDYVEVKAVDAPEHDEVLEVAVQAAPVELDGEWTQVWQVVDKFREYQTTADGRPVRPGRPGRPDEELITVTKEEQEAEALQKHFDSKAGEVRAERNALLTASDWTQVADAPLSDEQKAAWAVYRQELRDVTDQEGFPFNVTFPQQPE